MLLNNNSTAKLNQMFGYASRIYIELTILRLSENINAQSLLSSWTTFQILPRKQTTCIYKHHQANLDLRPCSDGAKRVNPKLWL